MQVEESTPFAPIARKEIGALAWHVVNELPMTKEQSSMVGCRLPLDASDWTVTCAAATACFIHTGWYSHNSNFSKAALHKQQVFT